MSRRQEGYVTQLSGAMTNVSQNSDTWAPLLLPGVADQACWYAVQTRPRYEKKVHSTLIHAGLDGFLPLTRQIHRWSDRRAAIQVPIFPCYLFVRITPLPANRLLVLRASGVIGFVGMHGLGTPIPNYQMDN